MSTEEFEYAQDRVWDLPRSAHANEMLELYKLYKQAVFGDCDVARPRGFDIKGQKKWDAWNSALGMPSHEARQRYVSFVKELFSKQGESF